MKKNINIKRSLRAKIMVILITVCVVSVFTAGMSSYLISNNLLQSKLEKTSAQTIQETTRGLDSYINYMSDIVKILAMDSGIKNADNEESLNSAKELMDNIRSTDESILNIFTGTEKGLFYTSPYAQLPEDFNHKTRGWYIEAMENPDQIIITDPYVDTATGELVVSFASAVTNNNEQTGVVGMDISLARLSESLSDIRIGDAGYVYIADNNGILITHSDKSLIGTDTIAKQSFWSEMSDSKDGFFSYNSDGSKKFSVYNSSELTGWKIAAVMDYAELEKDTGAIRNTLVIIQIAGAVCAVIIALLFSRPIARNTRKLLAGFESMAQGDLTARVEINSKDEFSRLGDQFNSMAQNMSGLLQGVNEAADTVLDTAVNLSNVSEETNASIGEVAKAVEEIAHGATEQAQNASEGAMSISDLSENLDIIGESTNVMNSLSGDTQRLTMEGMDSVKTLIVNSSSTMESTNRVSELVAETKESVTRIDEISNAIDEITEQTNLLALNASIEAARAGESGKGFAVVADEIRKLAEESKESTVKIKMIVRDIDEKTNLSVEAMQKTNENVKEQAVLVEVTQNAFQEIIRAVGALSDKILEIKNWTEEIGVKKEHIVAQIENISSISQETASTTEEVTASTEQIVVTVEEIAKNAGDLQELSEKLQEKLSAFKLK